MEHIRHGDILLTRIDSLPEGEELKHDGSYILAYGEVTGHKHVVTVAEPETLKIVKHDGAVYMSITVPVDDPAILSHEEHKTIEVPAGFWKISFEQEYDYALENINRVID